MARKIVEDIMPTDWPIRSGLPMEPKYITIHNTANKSAGASAKGHADYMRTQGAIDREVLWHYTVDDHEAYHHLPNDEVGWHAGDGYNGPGNRTSIAIEICENVDGDQAKTDANAAELAALLIKTEPTLLPFPECLVQHNHWTGKNCPDVIRAREGGWEAFLATVQLHIEEEDPAMIDQLRADLQKLRNDYTNTLGWVREIAADVESIKQTAEAASNQEVASWAKTAMEKAVAKGIIKGDGEGYLMPNKGLTRQEFAVTLDSAGLLDK